MHGARDKEGAPPSIQTVHGSAKAVTFRTRHGGLVAARPKPWSLASPCFCFKNNIDNPEASRQMTGAGAADP